jgi:hypothetical protein
MAAPAPRVARVRTFARLLGQGKSTEPFQAGSKEIPKRMDRSINVPEAL